MAIVETTIHFNTIGKIRAFGVSEEVYMCDYAEDFCEWVNGTVIQMSPVHDKHDLVTRYLAHLLDIYLELRPLGRLRQAPFVMRLQLEEKCSNREPDLQIILGTNPHNLTPTFMDGPADIVIEVVSLESQQCDYAEKFHEYEQAGVPEYWIIDPIKKEARFYRLNQKKAYVLQEVEDNYSTNRLAGLTIHIPTFWQDKLPGPIAIGQTVQSMLK